MKISIRNIHLTDGYLVMFMCRFNNIGSAGPYFIHVAALFWLNPNIYKVYENNFDVCLTEQPTMILHEVEV